MRRFIITLVFISLCLQAEAANRNKGNQRNLTIGIVATLIGGLMIVDGTQKVVDRQWDTMEVDYTWQKDVSNPEITIITNTWSKELVINWWAHHDWRVKNTGNVTITDADVSLSYYNTSGAYIGGYTFSEYLFAPNDYDGWNDWLTNCGSVEPVTAYLSWTIYTYNHVYETQYVYKNVHHVTYKNKNEAQAIIGAAGAGYGIYLIVDYLKAMGAFANLYKHNFDVRVVQYNQGFGINLIKRI